MSPLPLDDLRIQNFRTFKDLTIDRLGRVNLIVGKNNTGKTALLESIYAWANPSYFTDLAELVQEQIPRPEDEVGRHYLRMRYEFARHLIHGRPNVRELEGFDSEAWRARTHEDASGSIGPQDEDLRLYLHCRGRNAASSLKFEVKMYKGRHVVGEERNPVCSFSTNSVIEARSHSPQSEEVSNVRFVNSGGLKRRDASRLWDGAIRKGQKQRIVRSLKVVEPSVEGLDFINETFPRYTLSGDTMHIGDGGDQLWMVSLNGEQEPVPINTMGEGMERALFIGLAQVAAEGGILLIDEFENGLHHTVQRDLWEMVFDTARELDVQVFATTHSYDCIRAFQGAAAASPEEGRLISLRRSERPENEGQVVAVPYDEDTLASVAESNIEVR